VLPRLDKITYDEVRDDLVAYYQTRGTRDLNEAKGRLIHIDAYFNGRRLVTVTPALITTYVQARQAPRRLDDGTEISGATNGTINRELSTLSKLLRLAYEHGKLQRPPLVKKLREPIRGRASVIPARRGRRRAERPASLAC